MLSEQRIKEIVERLADAKFVNQEAFSPSEIQQILKVWRKHPEHPDNQKK